MKKSCVALVVLLSFYFSNTAFAIEAFFQQPFEPKPVNGVVIEQELDKTYLKIQELFTARQRLEVFLDQRSENLAKINNEIQNIDLELERLAIHARELELQSRTYFRAFPQDFKRTSIEKKIEDLLALFDLKPNQYFPINPDEIPPLDNRHVLSSQEFRKLLQEELEKLLNEWDSLYKDWLEESLKLENASETNAQTLARKVNELQNKMNAKYAELKRIHDALGYAPEELVQELGIKLFDTKPTKEELESLIRQRQLLTIDADNLVDEIATEIDSSKKVDNAKLRRLEEIQRQLRETESVLGTPTASSNQTLEQIIENTGEPEKPTVNVSVTGTQTTLNTDDKIVVSSTEASSNPIEDIDLRSNAAHGIEGGPSPPSDGKKPSIPLKAGISPDVFVGGKTSSRGNKVWEFLTKERHLVSPELLTKLKIPLKAFFNWKPIQWTLVRPAKEIFTGKLSPFTYLVTKPAKSTLPALTGTTGFAKIVRATGKIIGTAFFAIEIAVVLDEALNVEKPKPTSPPVLSFTEADIKEIQKDEFFLQLPFTDSLRKHSSIFIQTDSVNNVFANDWKTIFRTFQSTAGNETKATLAKIGLESSVVNEFFSKADKLSENFNPYIEGITIFYFAFNEEKKEWIPIGSQEAEFDNINNSFTIGKPYDLPNGLYKYLLLVRFSPMIMASGLIDDFSKKTWEQGLSRHCIELDAEKNCQLVSQLARTGIISKEQIQSAFQEMRQAIDTDTGFWKNFGNQYAVWWNSLKSESIQTGLKFFDNDISGALFDMTKTIYLNGVISGIITVFNSPVAGAAAWTARDNLLEKINTLEKENFWAIATVYGVPVTGELTVADFFDTQTEIPSPEFEETLVELDGTIVEITQDDLQALTEKKIEPLTLAVIKNAMSVTVNGQKKEIQIKEILQKPRIFVQGLHPKDNALFEFSFTDKENKPVIFRQEYVVPSRVIWINGWFQAKLESISTVCQTIKECLAAIGKKFSEKIFD